VATLDSPLQEPCGTEFVSFDQILFTANHRPWVKPMFALATKEPMGRFDSGLDHSLILAKKFRMSQTRRTRLNRPSR
jgi:hypothetical protein